MYGMVHVDFLTPFERKQKEKKNNPINWLLLLSLAFFQILLRIWENYQILLQNLKLFPLTSISP